ncbi:MAG: hypothetical protein IJU72_01265 [Bacteroidales bacterium]|nr:hypothetical protein [Bacteroidales bacterium]
MSPKFDTCFFERYASISLRELLGPRFAHLQNHDRPDLQDAEQGIGIEVTRAIAENRLTAELLVNDVAADTVFDINTDDLQSIRRYGYAYGLHGGGYVGAHEYDYWALALPLRRILASKVRKVADGFYGTYREFGLYVFSREPLTVQEAELTMQFVLELQREAPVGYSALYINQVQQLYHCDLQAQHLHSIPISAEQCRWFYQQALA